MTLADGTGKSFALVLPWAILILRYASARSFANALRSDKSFYKASLRSA
jgi:hypothetical protein